MSDAYSFLKDFEYQCVSMLQEHPFICVSYISLKSEDIHWFIFQHTMDFTSILSVSLVVDCTNILYKVYVNNQLWHGLDNGSKPCTEIVPIYHTDKHQRVLKYIEKLFIQAMETEKAETN